MNITVVGAGYVGLVTATCFAESGNEVVCVDIDRERITKLKAAELPIYEPGLRELVARNLKEGRLSFSTDLDFAVAQSAISFIAAGTPAAATGEADVSAVFQAGEAIAKALTGYHVAAVKSTVPVGTCERLGELMRRLAPYECDVCSCPEFLKEGSAVEDFTRPDRIIIGSASARATAVLKELYAPFVRTGNPILVMAPQSAELTKYASNAMLAVRVSFINAIANLCEAVDAEISDVRLGIASDRRIGPQFLFPGIGYGGSCFPKDVRALIRTADAQGVRFEMLKAAEEINQRQRALMAERIKAHFGQDLSGRTFAVWGLAFKPRTDDMREAPSVTIIQRLLEAGAALKVHDPEAMSTARRIFGDRISYYERNYDAVEGADALLICTEWNEFRHPNFQRVRAALKQPVIFDGRNLYDPELLKRLNFRYYSIGRRPV
jgi:UDPglucose 6-dehydrogenase